MPALLVMRTTRLVFVAALVATLVVVALLRDRRLGAYTLLPRPTGPPPPLPPPKYLPEPTWTPPPVRDPFPALATAAPAVPAWNAPAADVHARYGLDAPPPLLIGFTRSWPLLLQAVVSYIAAGWPPASIRVVENTGALGANAAGRLGLQNPFFLNHSQLALLGVAVVEAPVLMSFAQLQNFYLHLARVHGWRWYFWSHMDVLVLSYEGGLDGVTAPAGQPGYRTVYELCLGELNRTRHERDAQRRREEPDAPPPPDRWAGTFFSYDHLTLVNREAYEAVGGWDTFIPYYMTDCDMHSRLAMSNWTFRDARAAIVTDVSAVLDDLAALYRDARAAPSFTDPNPAPAEEPPARRAASPEPGPEPEQGPEPEPGSAAAPDSADLAYWARLRDTADAMFHHKHGARGRNTWQQAQRGGAGEPYHYPARGVAEAVDVLTEAGRDVFRRKWGHRDCDLVGGTRLAATDQWRVAPDW